MQIKPFRGLRPDPDLAAKIASLPYDVLDREEARALAQDNPHSFLHVIRPDVDLPSTIDAYASQVYEKGLENLLSMREKRWLLQDEQPAFYVYRLTLDDRPQTGIVGAAAIRDYDAGRIKKHEHTRHEKEDDRVRLNDALGANPGPVFLMYRGIPELNALVNGVVARPATVGFEADDVRHELWVVDDPAARTKIEELFGKVPCTYVADGHHRAAAAARVGRVRADRLESPSDDAPCHYFMAAHFPTDQLRVMDYNRVVRDLNGLDAEAFIERLVKGGYHVKKDHRAKRPPHRETFGMYVEGRWYLLTPHPDIVPVGDPVRKLDVSILAETILQPILGIADLRSDRRIDFVGGIRGMRELERRVDSGDMAVAFALYPTSLEDVMQVADQGRVMPPKSTWFEPKLRSGLVVQVIDGDRL